MKSSLLDKLLWSLLLILFGVCAYGQLPANKVSFLFAVNGFGQGAKFNKVTSLAVDEGQNLVFVCDMGSGTVDAFNRQGIARFQLGKQEKIDSPSAVAVDRSGNLYVVESKDSRIKVIDRQNKLVRMIDVRSEAGKETVIGRMTVGRGGDLYASDVAGQRVLVFDPEGKLKLTFGSSGTERGRFQSIEGIAVDRQGRVYVTDAVGIPVQVFDRSGKYIYQFGQRGALEEDFVQPAGITVDRFDQVWVADSAAHKVRVFDRSGFMLNQVGDYGMGEGKLFYPVDIALDGLGQVYILERGLRRLQVFSIEKPYQPFDR